MRTTITQGVIGVALGLTLAISSAWAADLSADSQMGALLDNPDSKYVQVKHLPDFVSNPQIEAARGMNLPSLQTFAPTLTDEVLAEIDKDLVGVSE